MENEKLYNIAKNIIDNSIKLKKDENILIELYGTHGKPLALEVMKYVSSIGARSYFNIIDYDLIKIMLDNANENYMKTYGFCDLERMKQMDAYLAIKSVDNPNILKNVSAENMVIYNKYYTLPVHLEERVKNTKWCLINYPNENLAKMSNVTLKEYTDLYYNVCTLDYTKLSNAMDKLVELMQKTDKVRIIGKGTDIEFSIKGIGVEKYFGTYNLPDGEVATAPVKESINGYITYNTKSSYNGIEFNNIKFVFKNGKIVETYADKKIELDKILDTDEGARYIGEFAFGLNPYITKIMGDVLFDEKIYGSFHLTPGTSIDEFDNGNRSAIHWDLVCIQTKEYGGGEIYFDDVLIRKDGEFVLEELRFLNKEKLV